MERGAARYILVTLGVMVFIVALGIALRFAYVRNACQAEERVRVEDSFGFSFKIVDENCDTLAKDEVISVYATKRGSQRTPGLFSRKTEPTLLFRYDPGRPDNPLPTVSHHSPATILISVPEVSSIVYQAPNWENMTIDYEIGHVDYPGKTGRVDRPGPKM